MMEKLVYILASLCITAIAQAQTVSTLAGSGVLGNKNGTGAAASFSYPAGVAVDISGNVYVADFSNHVVRKITSGGVVTVFAGTGLSGKTDGSSTVASFDSPVGLALDASGNIYLADEYNNSIRKITSNGVVTTFAGGGSGSPGNTNGKGAAASFAAPTGIAVDAAGNVYVADQNNHLIRKITSDGEVTTLAGSGVSGNKNGIGTDASFSQPTGVAVDAAGHVYVADINNNMIRKITPDGVVTTLAGSGEMGSLNGAGTAASFAHPFGVAVDASGNVYVGDFYNNMIRKITPGGLVTTLAGSGLEGRLNGRAEDASFYYPHGVAVDASGNVYVADDLNHMIRKITINTTTGVEDQILSSISIHPNPVVNILNVKTTSQINSYQITDIIGNIVLSGNLPANEIDVTPLNNGLYFIQINTNQGLRTIRFAKQ